MSMNHIYGKQALGGLMGANDRQVLMTVQASGVRSETGSSYKQNPGNSSGGSMSYRSPIISQASA